MLHLSLLLATLLMHKASGALVNNRFAVNPKVLPDLIGASVTAALRLGSGAFADGYSVSVKG